MWTIMGEYRTRPWSPATAPTQTFCILTTGPVPAGHRLVVEHVSGLIEINSSASNILVVLKPHVSGGPIELYSAFDLPDARPAFDKPTLAYLDAQERLDVGVYLTGTTFGQNNFITVTGYLLDCTAATCAAIAR